MTPEINIRPGSKDPLPVAEQVEFLPKDEYNIKLVANGGPKDYVNPEPLDKYDLVSGRVWVCVCRLSDGLSATTVFTWERLDD